MGRGFVFSGVEQLGVGSWRTIDGQPPDQVHLTIDLGPGLSGPAAPTTMVVRFKGPETLDELIRALIDCRKEVWGCPPARAEGSPRG